MNEVKVWRNMVILVANIAIFEIFIFIVFLYMFKKRKINLQDK
jgi:hypothetical protein